MSGPRRSSVFTVVLGGPSAARADAAVPRAIALGFVAVPGGPSAARASGVALGAIAPDLYAVLGCPSAARADGAAQVAIATIIVAGIDSARQSWHPNPLPQAALQGGVPRCPVSHSVARDPETDAPWPSSSARSSESAVTIVTLQAVVGLAAGALLG